MFGYLILFTQFIMFFFLVNLLHRHMELSLLLLHEIRPLLYYEISSAGLVRTQTTMG